jgi:hypothetical protein
MEAFVGVGIPAAVSGHLGWPIPAVHAVPSLAMLLAAMPETAVHEDRHPIGWEHNVSDTAKLR